MGNGDDTAEDPCPFLCRCMTKECSEKMTEMPESRPLFHSSERSKRGGVTPGRGVFLVPGGSGWGVATAVSILGFPEGRSADRVSFGISVSRGDHTATVSVSFRASWVAGIGKGESNHRAEAT